MAIIHSPLQPSGTLGDITFAQVNGKTVARRATPLRGNRWWKHKKLFNARARAIEFGGASQAAKAIRDQLPRPILACARQYSHNELLNAIRRCCTIHRSFDRQYPAAPGKATLGLTALSAQGIAAALHRLQLGRSQHVRPQVTLHGDTLRIAGIPAFIESLGAISAIYLRIHIIHVRIAQMQRIQAASARRSDFTLPDGTTCTSPLPCHSTGWMPHAALQSDTIDLPAPPIPLDQLQPGEQLSLVVAIEWRRYTGLRHKNLTEHSTLTFIHRPVPTSAQPTGTRQATSPGDILRHHYRSIRLARAQKQREAIRRMRTDPKVQLQEAIARLMTPS